MEDFGWVKEIKPGIPLKPNTGYYVECGYDFDEGVIRNAFNRIFGKEMVNHSFVDRLNLYINLFDNSIIHGAIEEGCNFTFSVKYDDEFIYTGWCQTGYFRDQYPDGEFIPMDDFINYCVVDV